MSDFKSELTEIPGMDSKLANLLYNSHWKINTVENLAKLGTNELIDIKNMTPLEAEDIIISAIQYLNTDDCDLLKINEVERYKDETSINVIISEISNQRSTLSIMLEVPTDTRSPVITHLLDTIDVLIDKGCELTGMTQEEFTQMANNKNPNSHYDE